jgi:hypothetical protein
VSVAVHRGPGKKWSNSSEFTTVMAPADRAQLVDALARLLLADLDQHDLERASAAAVGHQT